MQNYQPPALLSRFNETEILHVARRKTLLKDASGRPLLTPAQHQAGLVLFEQHLQTRALGFLEIDYDEVFDVAAEISKKHGVSKLVRTADLLHIAMMEFGFDHVTADRQQHDFAQTVADALERTAKLQEAHAKELADLRRKLTAVEKQAHTLELKLARAEAKLERQSAN